MSTGERIKRIIFINNRTIKDTAKAAYIPYKRLSAILHGDRDMTVGEFATLCKVLEIDNFTILDMVRTANG